ncbi:MAG: hypothetical protein WCJ58_04220 [bacterium]
MIFIFHGENSYASATALKKAIQGKEVKIIWGDELDNIGKIVAAGDSYSLFANAPQTQVIKLFFHNKKKSLQEALLNFLEKNQILAADLYFWEASAIDKRTKIYKFFLKHFTVQEFKSLSEQELINWVKKQFEIEGLKVATNLIFKIIEKVGPWQEVLIQEIEKITLYLKSQAREIFELKDLEIISATDQEREVWSLLDALAARDRQKALQELKYLLKTQSDYPFIVSMLARQLKILFLLLSKEISRNDLTERLKLHPFVLSKASKYLYKFDVKKIKFLFSKIVDLDFAVKQGRIEPIIGLNLFIASI